jgi:aryl-alcohol dehydrogenase-like predicted oxidoreductase
MTFGEEMGIGAGAEESRRVYDAFLAAGGNFIDTANIYNRGTSEKLLGEFMQSDRTRLVIASKFTLSTDGTDPNAGGSHRKNLVQALDASLTRLKTDYLDLYWVHGWDRHTDLAELMRALDDQVRAGKILHLGMSNAPAWVVATANTLASERGLTPFCALQLHYNLVERSIEPSILPMAKHFDLGVTAWSPLAGGVLSGKYTDGKASGRLQRPGATRPLNPKHVEVAAAVGKVANSIGCSSAAVALAWVMQRGTGGVMPIIGARTEAQLKDNLGCLDVQLSAPHLAELDALMPPAVVYPESLLAGEFFQDMMLGKVRREVRWSDL